MIPRDYITAWRVQTPWRLDAQVEQDLVITVKLLAYDGQGFWLAYKRLSKGRFSWWPRSVDEPVTRLQAHELQVLLCAGDPTATNTAPVWRPVAPA